MDRRQFLAGATVTVSIGTAGCLGSGTNPSILDGMTVATHHVVGSHLVDSPIGPSGETPRSYQTIIIARTTARKRMRDEDEISEFIQETDFDQSYLVVIVAAAWQNGYWLELDSIDRVESGLEMATVTASPDEPVGDDAAVHSLAVRVTDEQGGVPDKVEVRVNGTPTGTAKVD